MFFPESIFFSTDGKIELVTCMKDFCVAQEKKLTEGQQSMAKLKTFI